MTDIQIQGTSDGRFEVVVDGCPHWLRHDTREGAEAHAKLIAAPEDAMTEGRLLGIEARAQAATPGRWTWAGNSDVQQVYLRSEAPMRPTVMDFVRWGFQHAAPRFNVKDLMYRADEFIVYQVDYRKDIRRLNHPDAEFIAHSREDVPALCARIRELEADNAMLDRISASLDASVQKAKEETRREQERLGLELQRCGARVEELEAAVAVLREERDRCQRHIKDLSEALYPILPHKETP